MQDWGPIITVVSTVLGALCAYGLAAWQSGRKYEQILSELKLIKAELATLRSANEDLEESFDKHVQEDRAFQIETERGFRLMEANFRQSIQTAVKEVMETYRLELQRDRHEGKSRDQAIIGNLEIIVAKVEEMGKDMTRVREDLAAVKVTTSHQKVVA